MLRFIDDLAGAFWDLLKTVLVGFCYFLAGLLIVGVPMILITYFITWLAG